MDSLNLTSTQTSSLVTSPANPFPTNFLDPNLELLATNSTGNGDLSYQSSDLTLVDSSDFEQISLSSASLADSTTTDSRLGATSPLRINAGGNAYTDPQGNQWQEDQYFTGGNTYTTSDPITGTTADPIYQTERYGDFSYAIPVTDGSYDLDLQLAEIYFNDPDQRIFDITVEGELLQDNLDLVAQVGSDTAYQLNFDNIEVNDGVLDLRFTSEVDKAKLAGIELTASSPAAIRINAGGNAYTDSQGHQWQEDQYFTGGNTYTTSDSISGTENDPIYQTERYGDFSYAIPVTDGNYDLDLQLAEIYFNDPDQRIFDITVEGELLQDNLDLVAQVGSDTAYQLNFNNIEVNDGVLDLRFTSEVNKAKLAGIELTASSSAAIQQSQAGLVVVEAEQYTEQVTPGEHQWTLVSDSQASGTEALQATPDNGTNNNTGYVNTSPRLDYTIEFNQTGQHYVWVLGRAAGGEVGTSDSLHIGFNGQAIDTSDRINGFDSDFGWSNQTMDGSPAQFDVSSVGVHTLNLWMREDGFMVDQVILTPDPDFDPVQGTEAPKAFEQDQNGLVSLEAEAYHQQVTPGEHQWTLVSDSQASGTEALQATPDNGTNNNTDYVNTSPRLDYTIEFNQTGQHYVWVLGRAAGDQVGTSDSLHIGLNGQAVASSDRITGFGADFGWSNQTMDGSPAMFDVPAPGVHDLNLWMREDGFVVDQVIVSADPNYDPLGTGDDDNSSILPRIQPAANLSYDDPPFAEDRWTNTWGVGGLAPELWFWEDVDKLQDPQHLDRVNNLTEDHEAAGLVPVTGLQLWKAIFKSSQPGGSRDDDPGHAEWVQWVEDRPHYLGVSKNGNNFGWGYVSPLMPLDQKDHPDGFQGDTAYYADWQADRLGQLAAATGINGYLFSDFFDSHPHTGPQNYFNERIIDDFEQKTGITLSQSSLTQQAEEIRSQHYQEWVDYWTEGWAYNWEALAREIRQHTGEEPWLINQTSFTPAVMRRHGAIDVREIVQHLSPDNFIINVQTVQPFMMNKFSVPESRESATLGIFVAREPEARYGHILMSSEDRYWEAVDELWPELSDQAQEELGWKRLKRTWLESGWTHIATRQGDVRRAAESWQRSYHDAGETNENWVDLLRDIDPTRPFGPAVYYSVNIERAVEKHSGADNNPITTSYLGQHLTPLTNLKEAGVPFNYYVSDATIEQMDDDSRPSAWVIPDRYLDGEDLLPAEERQALEAAAPILSETEAKNLEHPLSFSTTQDRTITGFGFYDQNDRLIVVASDRIEFGETNENLNSVSTTVKLELPDGEYVARELLTGEEITFNVTSGSGEFETEIARWDTQAFAITSVS